MSGPLPYIGGKRRLAKTIVSLIPNHRTYVEPFAGGCQVFFRKPRSAVEILNDLDDEVLNYLRVCQHHHGELARCLEFTLPSRRLFEIWRRQATAGLTDIQRAARFLYLQKNSFGGQIVNRSFRFTVAKPADQGNLRLKEALALAAERLRGVQLEHAPYEKVIERYDRPETFFYLDPPYVGARLYRHNLSVDDFRRMRALLQRIRGKFLLSINDCGVSRETFADFQIKEVAVPYTSARTVPTVRELLIGNFALPPDVAPPR